MNDMNIPFVKMNGLGNQIIVADVRETATKITQSAAVALDGDTPTKLDTIMEVHKSSTAQSDAGIRILNSDGSEAGACGNGTRCVVSWLNKETSKDAFTFKTAGGILTAKYESDALITVDMGVPKFGWEDIPLEEEFYDTTGIELQVGPIDDPILHTPSVANVGNPHCIFWAPEDVWSYDLKQLGSLLEFHPVFADRVNISLANVKSRDHIILRTWERGAGLTQACGSAACAAAVCAIRKDLTERKVTVTVPGGDLHIEWTDADRILMTGPAEYEFSGMLNPLTGAFSVDGA